MERQENPLKRAGLLNVVMAPDTPDHDLTGQNEDFPATLFFGDHADLAGVFRAPAFVRASPLTTTVVVVIALSAGVLQNAAEAEDRCHEKLN